MYVVANCIHFGIVYFEQLAHACWVHHTFISCWHKHSNILCPSLQLRSLLSPSPPLPPHPPHPPASLSPSYWQALLVSVGHTFIPCLHKHANILGPSLQFCPPPPSIVAPHPHSLSLLSVVLGRLSPALSVRDESPDDRGHPSVSPTPPCPQSRQYPQPPPDAWIMQIHYPSHHFITRPL